MSVLIGTSGFSYDDWRPTWYGREVSKERMLEEYAQVFPALEINATYYKTPGRATAESMVRRAAGRLQFAIKAPGDLTHRRKLDSATVLPWRRFLEPFEDAAVMKAALLQFPNGFHRDDAAVRFLGEVVKELPFVPLVVELRHASWDNVATDECLRELGVSRAAVDQPALRGMSQSSRVAVTGPIAYFRFHGRNAAAWYGSDDESGRYRYRYSKEELLPWIPLMREAEKKAETSMAFFNNHPDGNAPEDALMLSKLLEEPLRRKERDMAMDLFGE